MNAVAYPHDFLTRPCDRKFVLELQQGHDIPRSRAELLLYRIWADFATGAGARREVVAAKDPEVPVEYRIMEQFCEWEGPPGAMVEAGVRAGFLTLTESGEHRLLEASGFAETNRGLGRSMQSKGSRARTQNIHRRKADEELDGLGGLFEHAAPPAECGPDLRRAANGLALQVWRALGLPEKQKPVLNPDVPADVFQLALGVVKAHPETTIQRVLRYLIGVRDGAGTPKRVDAVLRDWERFVAESAE